MANNTNTNLQKKDSQSPPQRDVKIMPIGNSETAKDLLHKMQPEFEQALGQYIGAEKFARIALTTINKNDLLLKCTRGSVLSSLLDCAQLGLEPDNILGRASLIPYWNTKKNHYECQLVIGYKGYVTLAHRTGTVASIDAEVVYDCDQFKFQKGTNAFIQHIPSLERPEGAKKIAAYSIIKQKDGGASFDIMPMSEILAIRDRSQNYQRSKEKKFKTPWDTDEDEMCKKTVLRRHMKKAHLSSEFVLAIQKDRDDDYINHDQQGSIPVGTQINGTQKPDLSTNGNGNPSNQSEATDAEYAEVRQGDEDVPRHDNGEPLFP